MTRHQSRQRRHVRAVQKAQIVWFRRGLAVALGVGLVGLPVLLHGVVRSAARFELRDITVVGLRSVPPGEVFSLIGFRPRHPSGQDLLGVDLNEVRWAVGRHPWIQHVTARKVYPDRLALHVVERVPVAMIWTADGLQLIAEDGVVLGPAGDRRLPFLKGLRTLRSGRPGQSGVVVDHTVRLEAGERLSAAGFEAVAAVVREGRSNLQPDLQMVVFSRDGREVVMEFPAVRVRFSSDRFATEWPRWLLVRGDLERRGLRGEVDLRFPGRVVVRSPRSV